MNKTWTNDDQLFAVMKAELFSAVVGDIMDKHGYLHQFLPPQIQPLRDDMVVLGRALPVLEADMSEVDPDPEAPHNKPFGLMLDALDDLRNNEVYVCTGASPDYALWGELMSTRAMILGAAGAVVNGYARDTRGILSLGFPTFAHGRYSQDQSPRGKVVDFRIPIDMEGVRINPGDIIFGDLDGVCVIPREVEDEVIIGSLEKARGEKTVKLAIENGMSAADAFEKYGIM